MQIALLGFGVVGGGVYAICQDRSDLRVTRVLVRSDKPEIAAIATRSMDDIVNDLAIDTVAEVMGGIHPAKEYVEAALNAGKHVVTANKALIAACGRELTALAEKNGVSLRCTAAVGGGIPWLVNLERIKRLDTVSEVGGIMNGTTNFIMDAMHTSGAAFGDVLAQAQALGYAEADPSADIDGDDIRRKLAISAGVAFDVSVEETAIPTFGIRTVTDGDITAFRQRGFVCKLLATAMRCQDGVCAFVEPTLVCAGEPEAAVGANYNLITYTADRIGRQSFFGQGAGRFPTAGNVVQDCLDILGGKTAFYADISRRTSLAEDAVSHPYYVRTAAPDEFLRSVTVDTWGGGVITSAVGVDTMLRWAKAKLQEDPGCFVAGIR